MILETIVSTVDSEGRPNFAPIANGMNDSFYGCSSRKAVSDLEQTECDLKATLPHTMCGWFQGEETSWAPVCGHGFNWLQTNYYSLSSRIILCSRH